MIKNALISVFDKSHIERFSKFLLEKNINILSTGGTFKKIQPLDTYGLLKEVSDITEFPEILNGRVKTLHPKIHGGLLAKRTNKDHVNELEKLGINHIDLVVVNLYPFEQIVKNEDNEDILLENVDIGGHTLIRAAAKNYKDVLIATEPNDYDKIMDNWDNLDSIRKEMALKAWHHVTRYDMSISGYFNKDMIYRGYEKIRDLKYGTNPQQTSAGLYRNIMNERQPFEILNGNPGYINLLDAIYGWGLVSELRKATGLPSAASYKHNSPAGAAIAVPLNDKLKKVYMVEGKDLNPLSTAFIRARNTDPLCSFGDFIALSDIVDEDTARIISSEVSDGIIAAGYTTEAFKILSSKKGGNYVILRGTPFCHSREVRELHAMILIQDENVQITKHDNLDLVIANITLKYTQSNSVAAAFNGQTLGIGAGQQSRVDCVKLVKRKVENWYIKQHPYCLELIGKFKKGTKRTVKTNALITFIEDGGIDGDLIEDNVACLSQADKISWLQGLDGVALASDAFFPFRDNIDIANQFGVKYIIQPGGSIADEEIKKVCDNYGMQMTLTGKNMRMFLH